MHESLRNMGFVRLVGFAIILQKYHCGTNYDFVQYTTEELISWIDSTFDFVEGDWVVREATRKAA